MRIQIFPDILAALRRGDIPMQQITWCPHPAHPEISLWIEIHSPEVVRVADCSRERCPRELRAYLDRLDIELAQASIEIMPAMPDPPRPLIRTARLHFREIVDDD